MRRRRVLTTAAIIVALGVGVLVVGPIAVGYGWAVAWLPVYGAVCNLDKVFGSSITADGYRIFLLNRGCDVDTSIREIVRENDPSADAAKLVRRYHWKPGEPEVSLSVQEILLFDVVKWDLRRFVPPRTPSENDCPPDQYCAVKNWWSQDIVSNFFAFILARYASYAGPQLLAGINGSADFMVSLFQMGPLIQGALAIAYSIATLVLGKLVVDCILSLFKTTT